MGPIRRAGAFGSHSVSVLSHVVESSSPSRLYAEAVRRLASSILLVAVALAAASAHAQAPRPWLWQCEQIGLEGAKDRCYARLLYLDVERSGDPARELPRIDRRVRAAETSLVGRCHMLMHEVGRRFGRGHHVTLESLRRYVPRSNDPGCSAGFGMGLVMSLGTQLVTSGGRSAVPTCLSLPTRYRSYTCVHSLGHALMRGYHGALDASVAACRRLGARVAPDCAQGAFHDYWISLRGDDETMRPAHVVTSARVLCARYPSLARPCWYRFFLEQARAPLVQTARDVLRVCSGLDGAQRSGCVAAAAVVVPAGPFEQARVCAALDAPDAVSCLRGVGVQALAGEPRRQRELLARCASMPTGAQSGCYAWFGRTLNVVDNGSFAGCRTLATVEARGACAAGARRIDRPLVTFS